VKTTGLRQAAEALFERTPGWVFWYSGIQVFGVDEVRPAFDFAGPEHLNT
jgi:hypothetical protein